MPTPPVTGADFVALVKKSQLVDAHDLQGLLQQLEPLPEDVKPVVQQFLKAGLLTKFQAAHLLAGKHRGFLLGQYKILEQIGAGGMGVIFLGEHMGMRRKVAIKVLPQSRAADLESLERFYREVRVVAALDHPNIVRAHDAACTNEVHYLVMEYIEGRSLEDMLRKVGPLPALEAARYIVQAATGLQHAHERGLIHRDIKPANLLVDTEGMVKLLDMGLARFFDDRQDSLTNDLASGVVIGTADYIAPEQAVNSHEVDIRADIYSLGMTFYALLKGEAPFADSTVSQKLIAHHTRTPAPIHTLRPDVPLGMSEVINRMFAKSPADRYQSPAEVIDALAPWAKPRFGAAASSFVLSALLEPLETTLEQSSPDPLEAAVTTRKWPGWMLATVIGGALLVATGICLLLFT